MPLNTGCFYEFGPFRVDVDERLLFRDGERVELTQKPFDLLLLLVEKHGHLVTKEEIREKLWPDTFVEESNLTFNIGAIRRALGDDRQNGNRFVETVSRRGYRFTSAVTQVTPETEGLRISETVVHGATADLRPAAGSDGTSGVEGVQAAKPKGIAPHSSLSHNRPALRRGWLVVAASLIALFGAGDYLWVRPVPAPTITGGPYQLTHDRQEKDDYFLTTDGTRLYFCEEGTEECRLTAVPIGGGEAVPIPVRLSGLRPFDLSPDGLKLLAGNPAGTDSDMPVWVVSLGGESPERVDGVLARDAEWSPDGKEIVYANAGGLHLASADGTHQRLLTSSPGPLKLLGWSPDRQRLRFAEWTNNPPRQVPWEIKSNASHLHRILPGWNGFGGSLGGKWTKDGRYYLLAVNDSSLSSSSPTGSNWTILANREGQSLFETASANPIRLFNQSRSYYAPLPSPDGKKLFVIGREARGELVRYDRRDGEFVPYLRGLEARWVSFSKSGQWVAYVKHSDDTLWRMRPDGSEATQLVFAPMAVDGVSWSPNGRWVVARVRAPGRPFKICIISALARPESLAAMKPRELLPNDDHEEGIPTWSKDGRQIAFGDVPAHYLEGTGTEVIHICDVATGERHVLPGMQGIWSPRWSPDGRFISAVTTDRAQRLKLFDLSTQRLRDLGVEQVNNPTWSSDSRYIYFDAIRPGDPTMIWRVRVSDGTVEPAASLRGLRRADITWSGLAPPDDSPIILRDIGSQEIYAFDVNWP